MMRLAFVAIFFAALLPSQMVRFPLQVLTMKNGMGVILSPSKGDAGCTVYVTYKVGSGADPLGQSGLAHLTEHMMFRGSKTVGRGEHASVVSALGGVYNGSTGPDRTVFYETIPFCDDVPLVLQLEADRMKDLQIAEDDFQKERAIVLEEYRQRASENGMMRVRELLSYRMPGEFQPREVQGAPGDIAALKVESLRRFYARYYKPANASLVVTGNFNAHKIWSNIKQNFTSVRDGSVAGGLPLTSPSANVPTVSPTPQGSMLRTAVPRLDVGVPMPIGNTSEWYAALAMGYIAAGITPSRIERALQARHIDASTAWSIQHARGSALGVISVFLPRNSDLGQAGDLLRRVFADMALTSADGNEMDQYRTGIAREYFRSVDTTSARADTISQFLTFYNDASLINDFLARADGIRAEDIRRAATQYLLPDHLIWLRSEPGRTSVK